MVFDLQLSRLTHHLGLEVHGSAIPGEVWVLRSVSLLSTDVPSKKTGLYPSPHGLIRYVVMWGASGPIGSARSFINRFHATSVYGKRCRSRGLESAGGKRALAFDAREVGPRGGFPADGRSSKRAPLHAHPIPQALPASAALPMSEGASLSLEEADRGEGTGHQLVLEGRLRPRPSARAPH